MEYFVRITKDVSKLLLTRKYIYGKFSEKAQLQKRMPSMHVNCKIEKKKHIKSMHWQRVG